MRLNITLEFFQEAADIFLIEPNIQLLNYIAAAATDGGISIPTSVFTCVFVSACVCVCVWYPQ